MILKNYDLAFENWRFLLDKWNDMLQIQSTYFSVHFQYAFLKYVAYLQSTYLKEKIRIGYILKSADVLTLVSSREALDPPLCAPRKSTDLKFSKNCLREISRRMLSFKEILLNNAWVITFKKNSKSLLKWFDYTLWLAQNLFL